MKTQEYTKSMKSQNGFLHLFLNLLLIVGIVGIIVFLDNVGGLWWLVTSLILLVIAWLFHLIGFIMIQPNKAVILTFFGKYSGVIKENGFFWINPFYGCKRLSLRARNMDVEPIKVNDKNGNPIMIGLVIVWKIEDTYKAVFEIDAEMGNVLDGHNINKISLRTYDRFVHVQSDAALRKVAGLYAYDHIDHHQNELTLRSGGEEINDKLEEELAERLNIAGIKVIEARINYLAYASEIASVMLRRQQADAIIAARERIVEGAVSMVELALHKLNEKQVVNLDEEKKASMVSNLMVVLCADEAATPVINTGTLY